MNATPTCPVTTLPRSGLTVSRIGLGLADIHRLPSSVQRALIDTALETGVTHFDTAPFYGDRLSERILGHILQRRRDRVTITTKFGLLPTPGIAALGPLAPLGRKVRGMVRRMNLIRYPRQSYTPRTLQQSLAASLRALRTDHVDVLAIHEPAGVSGIDDDTIEALCAIRRAGAARLIGVAGHDVAAVLARWGGELDIVQTAQNGGRTGGRVPDFTYGLFSHVSRAGAPLAQVHVEQRLREALAQRPQGAVLVQTSNPQRLRQCVEIATG